MTIREGENYKDLVEHLMSIVYSNMTDKQIIEDVEKSFEAWL